MGKAKSTDLAKAGFKYIGRPYDRKQSGGMDCQDFVEQCLRDCGVNKDLGGSNSWYRECLRNGWGGTPEECKALFGSIPDGAFLFIWEEVSESTPEKFRNDGIGDLTHIGIVTGTGEGAIHSSKSRGGVCESKFAGKSIRGGWNRVGLWAAGVSYGAKVDAILEGWADGGEIHHGDADSGGSGEASGGEEETEVQEATVWSPNGGTVFLRRSKDSKSKYYGVWERLAVGTRVEVVERGDKWCKVNYNQYKGWWMQTAFLVFGGIVDPGEEDPADGGEDLDYGEGDIEITLKLTRQEAMALLSSVEKISWQLQQAIGAVG